MASMEQKLADPGAEKVAKHEVRLDTEARFRLAVWPRYDEHDDLEAVLADFGAAVRGRDDVTFCLIHDRRDGPLLTAVGVVEDCLGRVFGPDHGLDLLIVDDLDGPEDWPALGRSVSCLLAPPSADKGARAEFLAKASTTVFRSGTELSEHLEAAARAGSSELRLERPDMYFIRGESGQGKTSLALSFREQLKPFKVLGSYRDATRTRGTLVTTDRQYVRWVRKYRPEQVPASWIPGGPIERINEHYTDTLDDPGRQEFLEHLTHRIEDALETTDGDVIIEGWHLLSMYRPLARTFADRANVIPVDVCEHTIRIGNEFVFESGVAPTADSPDGTPAPAVQEANVRAARKIRGYVKQLHLRELLAETRYQCFDDLGQVCNNSDSASKLEALQLPSLTGKSALDIGCNAGYFSVKMRELGADSVLGIDTSHRDLEIASAYRDRIYELDGIEFTEIDVFRLEEQRKFDLIICLSVFHYFRQRQTEFLAKARRLLRPGGMLVLECGLSRQHVEQPFVELSARSVDRGDPCHFPNEQAIREMAEGFDVDVVGDSPTQPGDSIPRVVLHLRRQ